MKNILYDLYYGRISGWERRPSRTAAYTAINRKIADEKQYLAEKLLADDCQRFQALEVLYTQAHEFEQLDAYRFGFRLGVMLMCAVFMGEDGDENLMGDDYAER